MMKMQLWSASMETDLDLNDGSVFRFFGCYLAKAFAEIEIHGLMVKRITVQDGLITAYSDESDVTAQVRVPYDVLVRARRVGEHPCLS